MAKYFVRTTDLGSPTVGLRPWAVSIGGVGSLGSNFVGLYISTHPLISNWTAPPLLLSGANYWAH